MPISERLTISLRNLERPLAALLATLSVLFLFWNACTNRLEGYDGIEYLSAVRTLAGAPGDVQPKNIEHISLLSLADALTGHSLSLTGFHLLAFFMNLASLAFLAFAFRRAVPLLSFATLFCLAMWSRVFIHYSCSLYPDPSIVFWIGAWLVLERRERVLAPAAVLAALALNRPHAAVIVLGAVAGALLADRTRRPGYSKVLLGAQLLYFTAFCAFFFWVFHGISLGNVMLGIAAFHEYASSVNWVGSRPGFVYQPASIYFEYLARNLALPGALLALFGVYVWVRGWRRLEGRLSGLLLGSFAYLALLCCFNEKQVRYLFPLLPAWTLLLALALERLRAPALRTLAFLTLFAGVVPGFLHFLDPIYRENVLEEPARRIAAWGGGKRVVLFLFFAAFHPVESEFHPNDKFFYVYHWGAPHLSFFGGLTVRDANEASFSEYGYPIPDGLTVAAPPGVPAVLPSPREIFTGRIPPEIYPIYAVRWFPDRAGHDCSPRVKERCVEILTAYEGKR